MSKGSFYRRGRRGGRLHRRSTSTEVREHLVFMPPTASSREPAHVPGSPEEFCARLKAARERRGLTLAEIADSTKISPFLLASLEDSNVSRWPGGIYRRAFITSYLQAIDLPVEPTVTEFLQLFPDEEAAALDPRPMAVATTTGRLSLAAAPRGGAARLRKTLIELAIVALVAMAVSLATDWSAWPPALVFAAWYGRPVARWFERLLRPVRSSHHVA
jgi:transcriptional regulator with XRE-family HTH domain